MSKEHIKKNLALGLEFDTYVARHPEVMKKIPHGANIIITTKDDKKFNEASRGMQSSGSRGRFIEARKEGRGWKIELMPA